jgi:acetyl-CoA synthetase
MSHGVLCRKYVRPGEPEPLVAEYRQLYDAFRWADAHRDLEGLPGGGLNIAHEALHRHVAAGFGERLAMRFVARDWSRNDYTYAELSRLASQFANLLISLGIAPGERVFSLLGRIPELYIGLFGALKAAAVYSPLRTASDAETVQSRLAIGGGRVLVTTLALYQRTVQPMRSRLPRLEHVLLTDARGKDLPRGTLSWAELMEAAPDAWEIPATSPQAAALLHFTSRATGEPKGVVHSHEAVVAHYATARYALDLNPGDIYWCTADPGWMTGTSYGAIAPLAIGASLIVDCEEFDAERWYRILQEENVNVWYTTPAAIHLLMQKGNALATSHCFSRLRHMASGGEPLDPEAVVWGRDIFGMPFHDTWSQTRTGAIMIANFRGCEVRPGSMGRPVPGVEAAILRVSPAADGGEPTFEEATAPDEPGELALKPGWPSMFRACLDGDEGYRRSFAGGWYLTGDVARRDADGWFWFVGRVLSNAPA